MLTPQEMKEAAEFAEKRIEWEEKRAENLKLAAEQARKLRRHLNITKLIAVHVTDYFPNNGIILTSSAADANWVVINNKKIRSPRETIHFTLNGPVGSHGSNIWDNKKYAVLIPLKYIIGRIYNLAPHDSWVIGNLKLPKGTEILGKKKDLTGKKFGSATTILVPENTSTYEFISQRIKEKGYHLSRINMWNWNFAAWGDAMQAINEEIGDGGDITSNFSTLAKNLGKKVGNHNGSLFHKCEETIKDAYGLIYHGKKPTYSSVEECVTSFHKDIEELTQKLNLLIAKKKKAPQINLEEMNSLNRLLDTLKDINEELTIVLHRETVNASVFKSEIEADTWDRKEQKWLLREYSYIEKLKPLMELHDKKDILKTLKKISRIERRVFATYEHLEETISKLHEKDPRYNELTKDIQEHMKFAQAHLAKALSRGSTIIQRLVTQDNWEETEKWISNIESIVAMTENDLKKLHNLLKNRIKSEQIRKTQRHWKFAA